MSTGLGLLEKFGKFQKESTINLNLTFENSFDSTKTKLINRLETLNVSVNKKEEEINNLENIKREFFSFFENKLNEIYRVKDLTESRKLLKDFEDFVSETQNDFITGEMSFREKNNFLNKVDEFIKILGRQLDYNFDKENANIETLQEFSENVRRLSNSNIKEDIFEEENFFSEKMTEKLTQLTSARKESPSRKDKQIIIKKIYYVKENGIFSQYSISKSNVKAEKYRFYEVKFCISNEEDVDNIKGAIEKLKKLFKKFIIVYKPDLGRNFVTVYLSGIGLKQDSMKKKIFNIIKSIDKSCLIKLSLFSNIYDCLRTNIMKVVNINSSNFYFHHSNYSEKFIENTLKNKYYII